jgi:DNA-binding GntR family transcriptional regulator
MPLPESAVKLPRTLARDDAYHRLRGWIIEGTLQPGEVLRDQDIASSLGVSRTPVREALRRLEDEGFVETALNRWTRVTPLDLSKAEETYVIIEALEVLAMQTAHGRLTPEDRQRMIDANRAMRKAAEQRDATTALIADDSFHEVWIHRAGNMELSMLLSQLKSKVRRIELAYFDAASRARESFREHVAIVQALHKQSFSGAVAAVRGNWRGSVERMRTYVEERLPERSNLTQPENS